METKELYPGEISVTKGLERDIDVLQKELKSRGVREPRNGFDYRAEIDRSGKFHGFNCLRCLSNIVSINSNVLHAKRDYYLHWLRDHVNQKEGTNVL